MRANNLRQGNLINYNGKLWRIRYLHHHTPGNLRAFVQVKLYCITDGSTMETRLRAEDNIDVASLDAHNANFLYKDDLGYHFMDNETYEQFMLTEDNVSEVAPFLQENMECNLQFYEGQAVGIDIPMTVELEIVECEPPLKGATASGSPKPAVLENGITVSVPNYIEVGTRVRVDTRTSTFIERV